MSDAGKAVFLSYASQDAEPARRICEALRAAGVEVWLDQEGGLGGGDAWDRKIRGQIATCALFVPVISANTQARLEGYFRLEWKLAAQRTHTMADAKPFLLPVVIDATGDAAAHVPDEFRAVQWTRLRQDYGEQARIARSTSSGPAGSADSLAAFCERVKKLLGGEVAGATSLPAARGAPGPPAEPPVTSDVTGRKLELPAVVQPSLQGAFETFVPQRSPWRRALPVVAALGVGVLLTVAVESHLRPTAAPAPVNRFSYRLPDGQTFRNTGRNVIAVSPDGRRFVYNATGGLYLRSLDELEAHVIPGTEELLGTPFFSPDGRSVGYTSQSGQLKRVAISGGAPVVICAAAISPFGASWAPDGTILFGQTEGILRVPATGGTPAMVIPAQNGEYLEGPQLLPDGDTVLLTVRPPGVAANDGSRIVAQKISTGERKVLVEGGVGARYLATGHLVYVVRNVLTGVAFNARQLAVTGGAVPVVQGVMMSNGRNVAVANYGVAADGTLVWIYSAVFAGGNAWQLALSDRAGKLTPLTLPPGPYDTMRVSPDGTRVAVGVADSKEAYIAIYDLDGRTALRRLTFGGNNRYPVWSRDGEHVTFQSDREGARAIFWQRADGSIPAERLTKSEKDTAHVPASWSPKDETLLFTVVPSKDSESPGTLWTYARASGTAAPFGNVKGAAQSPMFSPDGRWVAFVSSDGSGGTYIQPFPATGAQYQLPRMVGGNIGRNPFWSPDGAMLFFAPGPVQFAAVTVTTQPTVAFGNPTLVPRSFPAASLNAPRPYDIMPDGRMIGLIAPGQAADAAGTGAAEIRIVEHWTEELKRLVPVK